MTLGSHIRELRKASGLTQRQLAGAVGIDPTYLSKIENGRLLHTPSLETIRKLAKALDIDELELLELAGKVPPILEDIAQSPEALRFLRKAREIVNSAETWRALSSYLDEISSGDTEQN